MLLLDYQEFKYRLRLAALFASPRLLSSILERDLLPMGFQRLFTIYLVVQASLAAAGLAGAQQLPPVEPPKPMPHPAPDTQNIQVTTTEVLVPTLVEKKDGGVVYGLKANDFVVEDDGVPQKIRVQEEMDTAPVALVVAVEEGGASVLEFDKLAHLGPLLDLFLAEPKSQVALIGFDSQPQLIQDFTHAGEEINDDLRHLEPGDGVSPGVADREREARPREQTYQAGAVDQEHWRVGCAGAECIVFAGAGRVSA